MSPKTVGSDFTTAKASVTFPIKEVTAAEPALRRRLSPFLLGTALSVSLLGTACRPTPNANAAIPSIPTKLEKLQSDTIKESTEFVGALEAAQIVEVRAETQGRIEEILVEPGQEVGAGQAIMLLEPDQTVPEFEGALAGVEAARLQREAALKELEVAKAQRNSAQAEVDVADGYIPRLRRLFEEGAIAELQLDEGLLQAEAARNNLIAAEEQVAAAALAIQQADSGIRQSQAQADASLVGVQRKEVVTPIAGVVGNLPINLGDYVGTGDAVTKVVQTEALFLNIEIPANRSAQLETGLAVELLDPTGREPLATGSITFVSPTVDAEGQTILAKARFRNVDRRLRDGQNVQARLVWETQPGLLVPTTAISRVGGRSFVFLVDDQPNEAGQEVVRLSSVELGDIQGDSYTVISGLEEGDRIATSNILKLRDGVPIEPES